MIPGTPVIAYPHLVAELRWWFWAMGWGREHGDDALTPIAEYAADTELIRQAYAERTADH